MIVTINDGWEVIYCLSFEHIPVDLELPAKVKQGHAYFHSPVSPKRCMITPWLLLKMNRKSYIACHLSTFTLTLSDQQRSHKVMPIFRGLHLPNGCTYILVYYWWCIGSHILPVIWAHSRRHGVTSKGQIRSCPFSCSSCLLLRMNSKSYMNFNFRAFPLTGSDPKRSNQGQKGQNIENFKLSKIALWHLIKPYSSSKPRYDPCFARYRPSKLVENG